MKTWMNNARVGLASAMVKSRAIVAVGCWILVCLTGCTNLPPSLPSMEDVQEVYGALALPSVDAPEGVASVCSGAGSTETPDPASQRPSSSVGERTLRYLVSELAFSCTRRSLTTILQGPEILEINRLEDIVAWRTTQEEDSLTNSAGSIHLALIANFTGPPSPDTLNVWPIAVALASLSDFLRSADLRGTIVVTLWDDSQQPHHSRTLAAGSLPSGSREHPPYRRDIILTADRGPEVPAFSAIGPAWMVGWLHSTALRGEERPSLSLASAPQTVRDLAEGTSNGLSSDRFVPLSFPSYEVVHTYAPAATATSDPTSTSAMLFRGAELVDVLYALNARGDRLLWHIFSANVYWLLGILLPVLFVAALVSYFLVRIRTQRARSESELADLDKWLKKAPDALKAREKSRESLKAATNPLAKFAAWSCHQWQRWKHPGYTQARKAQKEKEKCHWENRTDQYTSLDEKQRQLLQTVFRSEWEGITLLLARPGNVIPFLLGAFAPAAAFLIAENIAQLSVGSTIIVVTLGVLGASATYLVLTGVVVVLGQVLTAYLWGSSIMVYLALNAVEVSAYSSINEYFDSQTVTVMFVCLIMLLGLPDAKSTVEKEVQRVAKETTHWIEDVGGWREGLWNGILAVSYCLLAVHCIGRATVVLFSDRQIDGLASMTAVTIVAVMWPLLVWWVRSVRD